MLIAQITDIHLGFDRDNPREPNQQLFEDALAHLLAGRRLPDLLIATGDLTDSGAPESYARLASGLAACPFPVLLAVGNHDVRAHFRAQFPDVAPGEDFIHYVAGDEHLRIIVLDTLEEGRQGGAFCETRAAWLRARLAEAPDVPTLIAMHHPPFDAGIEWIATGAEEPWVTRFRGAIAGASHIRGIICGHLHRPAVTGWEGTSVAICPSTAPHLALDLSPIDLQAPDARAMIIARPAGYALHLWAEGRLVTHFEQADRAPALASYSAAMLPLVRQLAAERTAS